MPISAIKKCPNGKYRIGNGECKYETREAAILAYEYLIGEQAKKSVEEFYDTLSLIYSKPGIDETGTSYRYRIRNPENFNRNTFKTIIIQKSPIIKGVVGKLKIADGSNDPTKLQSLIFSKDAGWTREKVQSWINSHKEIKEKNYEIK